MEMQLVGFCWWAFLCLWWSHVSCWRFGHANLGFIYGS